MPYILAVLELGGTGPAKAIAGVLVGSAGAAAALAAREADEAVLAPAFAHKFWTRGKSITAEKKLRKSGWTSACAAH